MSRFVVGLSCWKRARELTEGPEAHFSARPCKLELNTLELAVKPYAV